jgi:threonine/homoserine/homoserine lactone efflux protein
MVHGDGLRVNAGVAGLQQTRGSSMQDVSSFIVAAAALTGSPGPNTLALAAAGAAFGVRRSLVLFCGSLIGIIAVMMVTASGLTGLVLAQPGLGPVVRLLAAGYMLYLAYRIATAPLAGDGPATDRPPGFVPGLFLGIGNPKAYAAMAALFSSFVLQPDAPIADVAAKSAIIVITVIVAGLIWLLVGSALTRTLRQPMLGRAINVAFAILLVASVGLASAL